MYNCPERVGAAVQQRCLKKRLRVISSPSIYRCMYVFKYVQDVSTSKICMYARLWYETSENASGYGSQKDTGTCPCMCKTYPCHMCTHTSMHACMHTYMWYETTQMYALAGAPLHLVQYLKSHRDPCDLASVAK